MMLEITTDMHLRTVVIIVALYELCREMVKKMNTYPTEPQKAKSRTCFMSSGSAANLSKVPTVVQ